MLLLHHDQRWEWWLCLVSRQGLLVFSEALICLSYTAWKLARRPGAAPDKQSFGDFAALLAPVVWNEKMVGRDGPSRRGCKADTPESLG